MVAGAAIASDVMVVRMTKRFIFVVVEVWW